MAWPNTNTIWIKVCVNVYTSISKYIQLAYSILLSCTRSVTVSKVIYNGYNLVSRIVYLLQNSGCKIYTKIFCNKVQYNVRGLNKPYSPTALNTQLHIFKPAARPICCRNSMDLYRKFHSLQCNATSKIKNKILGKKK